MRLAFVTLCVLVFAAVAVSAVDVEAEDEAPVPTGFSLPNIFNPVLDRADGRDQAKTLVNLVAKEPKVAFGVGGPDAVIEDMWNGEKDPVSSASVAQLKMLKEVDSLTKLIDQGKKILKVLPRKEKRLSLLKRKLSKILDAKAKAEAEDKLDQQTALLNAIKKREGAMSKRLKALKNSQNKLQGSVKKLKKVIGGKKKGKKGKKGAKKGKKALPKVGLTKKSAGAASAKAAVRPSLLEADAEADIASEMESESEVEEENNQEQEMEFDAAEAFDQE